MVDEEDDVEEERWLGLREGKMGKEEYWGLWRRESREGFSSVMLAYGLLLSFNPRVCRFLH